MGPLQDTKGVRMSNDQVDTLTPPAMAAWLRETAANTRLHGQRPMLTAKEMNVAPHVAFRLEQAANDLVRLYDALKLVRWRTAELIDDQRWTVGTERWRIGQDAKVTIHVIDAALGPSDTQGK